MFEAPPNMWAGHHDILQVTDVFQMAYEHSDHLVRTFRELVHFGLCRNSWCLGTPVYVFRGIRKGSQAGGEDFEMKGCIRELAKRPRFCNPIL